MHDQKVLCLDHFFSKGSFLKCLGILYYIHDNIILDICTV